MTLPSSSRPASTISTAPVVNAWTIVAAIVTNRIWNSDVPTTTCVPMPRRKIIAGTMIKPPRSEEHKSELQSLMRISYAVFCLKKKNAKKGRTHNSSTYHTIQDSKAVIQHNTATDHTSTSHKQS